MSIVPFILYTLAGAVALWYSLEYLWVPEDAFVTDFASPVRLQTIQSKPHGL